MVGRCRCELSYNLDGQILHHFTILDCYGAIYTTVKTYSILIFIKDALN